MRLKAIIGLFLLVFIHNDAQESCSCDTLKYHEKVVVLSYWEPIYYDISKSWLENIEKDSLVSWSKAYIQKNILLGDEKELIRKNILKDESQHIQIRVDSVSKQIGKPFELFYYSTPHEYWGNFKGQDGIVFIRDCIIIGKIILRES